MKWTWKRYTVKHERVVLVRLFLDHTIMKLGSTDLGGAHAYFGQALGDEGFVTNLKEGQLGVQRDTKAESFVSCKLTIWLIVFCLHLFTLISIAFVTWLHI